MSATDIIAAIALAAAIISLLLQFGERRRRKEEVGLGWPQLTGQG